MRTKVSGDFNKLEAWAKRIERLGGTGALRDLSDALAEEALDLVAEGFRKETDPYGKRWARKAIPDGRQVLVGRTARLRRGWHRKAANSRGFQIGPSVNYAKYAQQGRGAVRAKSGKALRFTVGRTTFYRRSVGPAPARKMVPDKGRLPSAWRRALIGAARDFFTDRMGG